MSKFHFNFQFPLHHRAAIVIVLTMTSKIDYKKIRKKKSHVSQHGHKLTDKCPELMAAI